MTQSDSDHLHKLEQWSAIWQLPISIKKCSVMNVGNVTNCPVYKLNDHCLSCESCVKDLGIWAYVGSKLIFGIHINKIGLVAQAHRTNCIYRC